jgi:hypothetical protein
LVGTDDGYIRLFECLDDPLLYDWFLGDPPVPEMAVSCMAATDTAIVSGYWNGDMRIMGM